MNDTAPYGTAVINNSSNQWEFYITIAGVMATFLLNIHQSVKMRHLEFSCHNRWCDFKVIEDASEE